MKQTADPMHGATCKWDGCGEYFFTHRDCLDHVRKVHVRPCGTCLWEDCNFVSATPTGGYSHVRTHLNVTEGICLVCPRTRYFKWVSGLVRHTRHFHGTATIEVAAYKWHQVYVAKQYPTAIEWLLNPT